MKINDFRMKKFFSILTIAFLSLSSPSFVSAQSLGDLLKKGQKAVTKGKEVIDKMTKSDTSTTTESQQEASPTPSTNLANGIEVYNPISNFIEVEPIGLYAISKSENYGDAYLVMRVTQKVPKTSILLGSSIQNQKMLAADANGRIYNIDASGANNYDVVEGIPVIIQMNEQPMMFMDVKKGLDRMSVVKVGIIDNKNQGILTFKNVPIYWDQDPDL